jgi:hypothetical protein
MKKTRAQVHGFSLGRSSQEVRSRAWLDESRPVRPPGYAFVHVEALIEDETETV